MEKPLPRTFDFQSKLPKLPIPTIEETCKTLIESCKPLLTEEQLRETIKLTNEFKESEISTKLQQSLLEYAKTQESEGKSWLEEWWLRLAYLTYKAPLPINSNWYVSVHPHPAAKDFEHGEKIDPITRSAIIMRLALDFKSKLDRQELPIEMIGKKPLCMNQMTRIYGVTRVPKEEGDILVTHEGSRHMMVMFEDQIFVFDVYNKNNQRLTPQEIQSQLERIQNAVSSPSFDRQPAIGKLTGLERGEWAKARKELISFSPQNAQNLELIESSLMTFSFDNYEVLDEDKRAKNSLIGVNNRWFDKSVNFITYADGNMGATGEHSPSDAPAPASIFQWSYALETKESYFELLKTRNFEAKHLPHPTHLKWTLHPSFSSTLDLSTSHLQQLYNSVDLRTFRFSDYGTSFILGFKLSPDSWVQIAIQLAHYRLHRRLTAVYETGSTRGFFHGRTETVRSLTEKVGIFAKKFDDQNLTNIQKAKLLQEAIASHRDYLIMTVRGKSIDRHLLGLRVMAGQLGVKVPLFDNFGFKESSTWRISTSNMNPSDYWFCGFGPAYEDGYGICYCTRNNHLKFSITNFINNHGTSSIKFRESLSRTLYDMKFMLLEAQNSMSNL